MNARQFAHDEDSIASLGLMLEGPDPSTASGDHGPLKLQAGACLALGALSLHLGCVQPLLRQGIFDRLQDRLSASVALLGEHHSSSPLSGSETGEGPETGLILQASVAGALASCLANMAQDPEVAARLSAGSVEAGTKDLEDLAAISASLGFGSAQDSAEAALMAIQKRAPLHRP